MHSFRYLALALLLPLVSPAATDAPPVARSIADIYRLRRTEPRRARTGFDLDCWVIFHVHETNGALETFDGTETRQIENRSPTSSKTLRFGDWIHVSGTDANGVTTCTNLTLLARDRPPPISDASVGQLLARRPDIRPVRLSGTIVDAEVDDVRSRWATLILEDRGAKIHVVVARRDDEPFNFNRFLGAKVSVVGYHSPASNNLRQTVKNVLVIDSIDMITALEPPPNADPFAVDSVETFNFLIHDTRRASLRQGAVGEVLAVWGGNTLLLRTDSGKLVKGELARNRPPACGERIKLVGFPETDLYIPILIRADWRHEDGERQKADWVRPITPRKLQSGRSDGQLYDFNYNGKPVRLTGVVRGLPVPGGDGLVYLESDGLIATVDASSAPDALAGLAVGFIVEATGVCVMDAEKMTFNRVFPRINGYRIVLRSPDDVRIVARPPWWTPGRLLAALGLLAALIVGFVIWNLVLRRAVNRRGRELEAEITARVGSELKVYERTRLAVELHDSIAQNLTGATMEIRTADILADSDPAAMHRYLSLAGKTLDSCREDLRNCIWDLRNLALDEIRADEAIRRTLAPHLGDATLAVRFAVPRERLTDNTAHTILRIIRELVLNAIRHGGATRIQIAGSIEDDRLLFSVKDNGRGFDPAAAPGMGEGHFGLQGIRDRVKTFDGTVEIASAAGKGTKVTVALRLPPSSEKENGT